jgi:hypothetical protein
VNDAKYIGLDVHQATISATVLDSTGKLVMESILETKAATILQLIHGLRGSLHATFEEGSCAAWLHDLLKPHVTQVLACDPRKNALLKVGNKSDRIDSRKLAELLRSNLLRSVYHETPASERTEAGPSPVPVSKFTHHVIAPNGCRKSLRPARAAGRSFTTNSSMHCCSRTSNAARVTICFNPTQLSRRGNRGDLHLRFIRNESQELSRWRGFPLDIRLASCRCHSG